MRGRKAATSLSSSSLASGGRPQDSASCMMQSMMQMMQAWCNPPRAMGPMLQFLNQPGRPTLPLEASPARSQSQDEELGARLELLASPAQQQQQTTLGALALESAAPQQQPQQAPAQPPANAAPQQQPQQAPAQPPAGPGKEGKQQKQSVEDASKAILAAMAKKEAGKPVFKRPAAADSVVAQQGPGKRPSWAVERTRSQVLYRSGLVGKGQTKTFKYKTEAEKDKAIQEAIKLVDAEIKRRKLELA